MIKKFNQFINENDSHINWEEIEELCANAEGLHDCVPQNIRQWDTFIKQYERACDLVNGKWEPHYNWKTEEEFNQAVNEQFLLGKGYKYSIYECFKDFNQSSKNLFKNVDWNIIKIAWRFTTWELFVNLFWDENKLPLLPKKIGDNFNCSYIDNLTSLDGCPEYVGGCFNCENTQLTSLKGAPKHVGRNFYCSYNRLTNLEGAPNYVGGYFYCSYNNLPDSIPIEFPGEDLHKYIDL